LTRLTDLTPSNESIITSFGIRLFCDIGHHLLKEGDFRMDSTVTQEELEAGRGYEELWTCPVLIPVPLLV